MEVQRSAVSWLSAGGRCARGAENFLDQGERGAQAQTYLGIPSQQVPQEKARAEGDRQRRAGTLANVRPHVVPDVAVVFFETLGRFLQILSHVVADVVELVPRARIGISENLAGLVDLLLDEVAGAVKRGFFGHRSPLLLFNAPF